MDVTIKKVGRREGKDRFVLVDPETRRVLTVNDASERALRRFFSKRGADDDSIDVAFRTARERYEKAAAPLAPSVDQGAETIEDDDLLFELGLDEGSDADIH